MPISLSETYATFGNSHYMSGFLKYYESQIIENIEMTKCLPQAPNYYAWIHIASENIFYRIKEMIYINKSDEGVYDWSYRKLVNELFEIGELTEEEREAILLFAKIRHLLVHKGFPNPHLSPSSKEHSIAYGYTFTKSDVKAITDTLRTPENFNSLKQSFETATSAIKSLQQDFDHDFGSVRIRKIKC